MSLLALPGAYNSVLGSSPIPLLGFAIRLVMFNSYQTAASNVMQLGTGTTDFGFLRTYVLSNLCSGLRMSRQIQSNERGAGTHRILTVQQLSVHQALSCACIDIMHI